MVRRTKEQAGQTRSALLDAAGRLFFERGVAGTALDDIAHAAGVTRGAVYWHFRNKADLFEALYERARLPQNDLLEGLLAAEASVDFLGELEHLCNGALEALAADPARQRLFTILYLRQEPVPELAAVVAARRDAHRLLRERIVARLAATPLKAPWTPRSAAFALIALWQGLVNDWLAEPGHFDLVELGCQCFAGAFDSLGTRDRGLPAPWAEREKSA